MIISTENDALQKHDLYADDKERMIHSGAVCSIASELDQPVKEIAVLYEEILEDMKARAYVMDYLPLLVSKKVVERFRSLH